MLIRDVGQLRAVELGNHELCAAVSYMRLSDMNPRRWREKGRGRESVECTTQRDDSGSNRGTATATATG